MARRTHVVARLVIGLLANGNLLLEDLPGLAKTRADQRKKLERLCGYVSRPAVAEKRLSLIPNGNVRYQLLGIP